METKKRKTAVYMVAYTYYPTDPRVRREAETLASLEDFEVRVVVPKSGDVPLTTQSNGVSVVELNVCRYRGKSFSAYVLSYLKFLFAAFCDCTRLTLGGRVDVVHIHNMPDFLIFAALVPRFMGKKVILDIHDSIPETYIGKFKNKSTLMFRLLCMEEAVCCRLAHRVICVNHPQRDVLVERGIPAKKISVSMNVPDERWFSNGSNGGSERAVPDSFNLVFHGTLARRLGVDLTIQAISKLNGSIPGLKFHIIGTGDDLEELVVLTKNLGLGSSVQFHGPVPIEDLASALGPMQLGIISNRKNIATELMLPVKMLEYISLDIPVVAPPLKAIRHYFSDDMLNYFDVENVDSLSSAILDSYQNEEKRRRQIRNARNFLDRYGWERHKQDLIGLYRSMALSSGSAEEKIGKEIASC
jgi:glycosyltransferase involved in cell wall biosynthesis